MRNVPMVLIRDPRRVVLAVAILYVISLAIGWLVAGQLLPQPPDPVMAVLNIVVVAGLSSIILRLLPAIAFRAIFKSSARAVQAMGESRWADAVAAYQAHFAEVEHQPALERLRSLLFLDILKFSWRESALINIAYCQTRLGDIPAAVEAYERCLEVDPGNIVAISALNTIKLAQGQPVIPARDLIERHLFDPHESQRLTWILFGMEVLMLCGCFNVGSFSLFNVAAVDNTSLLVLAAGAAIMIMAGLRAYRWAARRLFLSDLMQGVEKFKEGDFQQSLLSFQSQYYVLEANSWLDRFRALILLSPTSISFREHALMYQVGPLTQLGELDQVVEITKQCLKLNPLNVFAHTRLDLLDAARKGRSTGSSNVQDES